MRAEGLVERLKELVEPVAEGLGLELVEVEFTFERGGKVLRVYIDKPGGVNIDDCSTLSRELSTILDVEDPIPERYSLEVSSPGLDRPLVKEKDFERFAGHKAHIKTREPIEGRRNFKVTIEGMGEGSSVVVVDSDGKKWAIPIALIEKARLEVEL